MPNQHRSLPPRYSMALLTAVLILGLGLCLLIALPFVPSLVWSLTLAVLCAPLEDRLRRRVRSPSASTLLTMAIVAVMVVAPAVLVTKALLVEFLKGSDRIGALVAEGRWQGLSMGGSAGSSFAAWVSAHLGPQDVLQFVMQRLGGWSSDLLQGSVEAVVNLLLTFYFLFYLLRDRGTLLEGCERMLPLNGEELRMVGGRVSQTVFASVYGTLMVAALQGLLGGAMFWWLGLHSPVFWGVIMGLLAVVPFLGAFVVWAPAAVILALNGDWGSALLLTVWGTLVVGLIDNIVYPLLVGRQLAMHPMVSFIAIIGGLIVFGAHGLVLGPILVAGALTLLEIWRNRMDASLTEARPG